MATIYENGTYLENNSTWHTEDSPWKAKQILKMIARNKLTPASVCEIGCGAGEILNQLSQQMDRSVKFSGYELSEQAYQFCTHKSKDNVHFYKKDLLNDESAFFDLVMTIDVFEHVEDYLGFLRQVRSKGTFKIFHIPLDVSVYSVIRNYPMTIRESAGHLHYFTKDTALASLEHAGYRIQDYFYTPAQLEPKQDSLMKKVLKPPRKAFFSLHQDLTVRLLGGFSLLVLAV